MEEKVKKLLEKHKADKDLTTEKDYIKPGWDWSEADLTGWNLKNLDLSHYTTKANFKEVVLKKTNLQKAYLIGANLQEADLTGAKLQEARLDTAGLQKAHLRGAYLQEARLDTAGLQKADLTGANLQKAYLIGANLQEAALAMANLQKAYLTAANLQKAYLRRANLQKAHLRGANLQKAHLAEAKLQEANLKEANLQEADLTKANLQEADLTRSNLRDAEFDEKTVLQYANLFQCKLQNSTLKNAHNQLDKIVIQERKKQYSEAKEVYLILKNYFRQEGMYSESGEYYYREKVMERKCNWKEKKFHKWFFNQLLDKVAGYGEKPERVIIWWVIIISLSAFIYWVFDGIMIRTNINYNPTPLEAIYFSIVTFTTLGFGDLTPKPGTFQIFASAEALLGAIFMAIFIFVFARKMGR